MEIPLSFAQVTITTTAGGSKELVDAVAGKTPRIHALIVSSSTTANITIASTGTTVALLPVLASSPLVVPFERTIEGAIKGTLAKNLEISSTSAILGGLAIVSSSTY